jgi:hypothetical protein
MKHGGTYKNNLKIWKKGNQKPSFDEAQTMESLKEKKMKKEQTTIYKTLHRNLKIEQNGSH